MQVLNIFHVLVAIAMVAFVLIQRGPGATAGAAFGSGASGTVFGSRGAGSFLSRTTWILAAAFCLISLTMAVVVSRGVAEPETDLGVVGEPQSAQQEVPEQVGPSNQETADSPALNDADQVSDLPLLDTSVDVQSSGDLPPLETEDSGGTEPDDGTGGGG